MRIIAGKLGGRIFSSPKGHRTHPMSDRVRGALFNSLGNIEGKTVLDAFAGTGALSFEAISRGAASAVLIDIDRRAQMIMKETAQVFNITDQCQIIRANASGWSNNNRDKTFDIVIAAPPYDGLRPLLIEKLTRHINKDGIFILDWPGKEPLPPLSLTLIDTRLYGDAQIAFYKHSTTQ